MKLKNSHVMQAILLGTFIFSGRMFAQTDSLESAQGLRNKHAIPNANIGGFELSTQALGRFGTAPHKEIKEGVPNYYAQFSLWVGAVTEKGTILVTSGDQLEKDEQSEWSPVPLSWEENIKTSMVEANTVNRGQFTDNFASDEHTPLGLLVTATTYCFSQKGYALYDYNVKLQENYSSLKALYIGLQADVDVPSTNGKLSPDNDKLGFSPDGKNIYIYDGEEETKLTSILGIQLAGDEKPIFSWWSCGNDPMSDAERYKLLKGKDLSSFDPEKESDYRFMASDGPFILQPGEAIHFTVAIVQTKGEKEFNKESKLASQSFTQTERLAKRNLPEAKRDLAALSVPGSFKLYPIFPNPFNSQARILFDIPKSGEVEVKIYNMLGQPIRTLFLGYKEAGIHTLTWDCAEDNGISAISGVYFLVMRSGERKFQQKIVLMK